MQILKMLGELVEDCLDRLASLFYMEDPIDTFWDGEEDD